MKNYRGEGRRVYVVSPGGIKAGGIVFIGSMFGVAVGDAASGQTAVLQMGGLVSLPKATDKAFTQGEAVYWSTASPWTVPGTGSQAGSGSPILKIGVVADATAVNTAASCNVRLNDVF
jgi:predicted RecA/RadA family phage recombinase